MDDRLDEPKVQSRKSPNFPFFGIAVPFPTRNSPTPLDAFVVHMIYFILTKNVWTLGMCWIFCRLN